MLTVPVLALPLYFPCELKRFRLEWKQLGQWTFVTLCWGSKLSKMLVNRESKTRWRNSRRRALPWVLNAVASAYSALGYELQCRAHVSGLTNKPILPSVNHA